MPKANSKKVKSKDKSKSPLLVVSDHVPDGYVLPVPNTTPYFDFVDDKTKAIKRPPNSFFIFRSEFRRQEIGRESQSDVSKLASIVWKRMSNEDKKPWYRLQREVKAKHAALYPNYKYRPGDSRNKDKEVIDEDDDEDDEDYEEDEDEYDEPADESASSASRAARRPRPYPHPDQRHLFMGYPGAPGQVGFNPGYNTGPIGPHAMQMFHMPGAGVNGHLPNFLPVTGPPNATFQLENIPDDLLLKEMKRRADLTALRKAEAARKKQKQQHIQQEQQRIANLRRNPYVGYLQNPVSGAGFGSVTPANQTAGSSSRPPRVMTASNRTTLPSHQPTLDFSMPTGYPQPAPNQGTQDPLANSNAWGAGALLPGQNGQNTMMPNWVERSETDWYINKPTYEASPSYNLLPYPIQATTAAKNPATTSNVTQTTTSANPQSHNAPEFDLGVIDPRHLEQGPLSLRSQTESQIAHKFPNATQGFHQGADAGSMSHNWDQEVSSSGSQGSSAGSSGVQQQSQPFQQLTLSDSMPSTSQTSGTRSSNYSLMNLDSDTFNQTQPVAFNARANLAATWSAGSEPSTENELWRLSNQNNA